MHPELFTLPLCGAPLKTYGFFLAVGFLTGTWLAMRRIERVKADPDTMLDVAFFSLVFGVIGARVFYVVHYWPTQFANQPSPLLAAVDITGGGLEFLGGFLGAVGASAIYLKIKKRSIRLYLDAGAPTAMWGLAFGRVGCFFNGCCFGGLCVVGGTDHQPAKPWAVEFPYGSAAHYRQWENRETTVPAELIVAVKDRYLPSLLPAELIHLSESDRKLPARQYENLSRRREIAVREGADSEKIAQLKASIDSAKKTKEERDKQMIVLRLAQRFPSRIQPTRAGGTSVSELQYLASLHSSVPVHPAQLYSAIHALLLSSVLSAIYYRRKRHGVVIVSLFLLYAGPRMMLEAIRGDNPVDVGGLTISQFVSLSMFLLGLLGLYVLYKWMPEQSPSIANERVPKKKTET